MLTSSVIDVPRPLVDSITSLVEALSVISLSLLRPRRNDTVVLALDKQRRGLHLFRTDPVSSHTFHHIVRECSSVPSIHGVVVASYRTSSPMFWCDDSLLHIGSRTLSAAGIQLIDWVVIGAGGMYCPRTLYNVPDPWPYGSTCV
jgi:hypothetical protein